MYRMQFGIWLLIAAAAPLYAQTPNPSPTCVAAVCEAGAIYVAALDSLRAKLGDTIHAPRVLEAVYVAPFKPLNAARPAAVAEFTMLDGDMLERRWAGASIVDSAQVVTATGALRPAGSLFVVSPIDWMGTDAARLEIARYPTDWNWGEQYFIWMRLGPAGWHAVRVEVGWQN